MAYASGTCTDWIDFLRKLKGYAAGTVDPATDPEITGGIIVPVADRWTVLTLGGGMTALPGSGSATDGEFYLQGPGSDPADAIIVGFKSYRNAGNSIYGVKLKGYAAYDNTLTFDTMPGALPTPACVALGNASFNVWFWVTGRRIMALARIGTVDVLLHAGFIQQFGTRGQYPYPLMIAGSVIDTTWNTNQNNFGQSCLPEPCQNGASIRWVDGTWQKLDAFAGTSATRGFAKTTLTYAIWPLTNTTTTDNAEAVTTDNEDLLFGSFSSTGRQLSNSEISAYAMFPCILHKVDQLIGQIEGLYACPGLGLNSGDTFNDGTYTYDVFKNTWRNEAVDFYCIRRV